MFIYELVNTINNPVASPISFILNMLGGSSYYFILCLPAECLKKGFDNVVHFIECF